MIHRLGPGPAHGALLSVILCDSETEQLHYYKVVKFKVFQPFEYKKTITGASSLKMSAFHLRYRHHCANENDSIISVHLMAQIQICSKLHEFCVFLGG